MKMLLLCVLVCACDGDTTAIATDLSTVRDLAVAPSCTPVCGGNQFCFTGDFTFVHDAGAGIVLGCNPRPAGCSSCDCILAQDGYDPTYCFCNDDGYELTVTCALL